MGRLYPAHIFLGIDIGSVAMKTVLADAAGTIGHTTYTRTQGRPLETALRVLTDLLATFPELQLDVAAVTGTGGRLLGELLGIPCINEVIAQATAIRRSCPQVRTLIEMGGQDSKIIFLPESPDDPRPMLDFAMNTNCAAGTGSFLDQQASRLGLRIEEEFGELALRSENPPRVAGRCSVFAKSDMIHLQQRGAAVHDIVAGLCLGLARNLKSNLAGGRKLPKPIAFCGGVAANRGVVRALEEVFGLERGELVVPRDFAHTGALGAVRVACDQEGRGGGVKLNLAALNEHLAAPRRNGRTLAPLAGDESRAGAQTHGHRVTVEHALEAPRANDTPVDGWLGLDVGSISTKIAVIDDDNQLLAKIYLMTAGRPIDAVQKVLREIGGQIARLPFPVIIRGAATTGSGRYLTGDLIGADLVINEITAQATAAAAIDPQVDTLFEIGGQDSKYVALDRGVVVDFEMNHACAAGTGSFLEEQAERLGVSIKGEFAELAFSSSHPTRLGERCTVFMESDLISHQQQGAPTTDLAAGLCYSIVSNYLNRVVGQRRIGQRIFFQGGTAFNRGVVAAFRQVTGKPITVPPNHEVTGAIGAAILARRHVRSARLATGFAGFEAADISYELRSFECEHCANLCEINEVTIAGRAPLYYGSRCDRYNTRREAADRKDVPNLFAERHGLLLKHSRLTPQARVESSGARRSGKKPTVGLPLALMNYQLLPLWSTLLAELGLEVVVTPPSNRAVIQRGVEAVLSTPCFPVKVAHGHVLELADRGVDFIFVPGIISLTREFQENRFHEACPYISFFPYSMEAALKAQGRSAVLLKPTVRLEYGPRGIADGFDAALRRQLGVSARQVRAACEKAWAAQSAFENACKARGREVLNHLPEHLRPVVVISRPYNGCDKQVSLDLAAKLRRLNVLAIPLDFLDLPDESSGDRVLECMYWKNGQRVLRAARFVRDHQRLHALYLSNFSCGPDSFLLSFFKRLMAPKPSLVLEIDEHSADAGVVTRLEAFLESLQHAPETQRPAARVSLPLYPSVAAKNGHPRTLFMPWMSDQSYAIAAAFRAHGIDARILPRATEESMALGRRHCTGKECLPCIITAGDMLHQASKRGFDPAASAFFMPRSCGPCRFGQYASLHKLLLDESGAAQTPIIDPADDATFYESWSAAFGTSSRLCWNAVVAANALYQARLALRPYETNRGSTDALYQALLDELVALIERKPAEADIVAFCRRAAGEFARLAVHRPGALPRIAIIGEIYVRLHDVANNDLVRQLESLGAQTTVASLAEYLLYCNWTRMNMARRDRLPRLWLGNFLQDQVQRLISRRINEPFLPVVGDLNEPRTSRFVERARPFLDPQFEGGETVLSAAAVMEHFAHGADGVVCVMPFGCMPTTIYAGLTKELARHVAGMPLLTLAYDGQQDPTLHTRLEAFLHQARAYRMSRGNGSAAANGAARH